MSENLHFYFTLYTYTKDIKKAIDIYKMSNLWIDDDYKQIIDSNKDLFIKMHSKKEYYGLWLKVKSPALWDFQHYVRHELFSKR